MKWVAMEICRAFWCERFFLIIFIQIFLINSLIFFGRPLLRDGGKCNEIILLNGKISSSKADFPSKYSSSPRNTDYLSPSMFAALNREITFFPHYLFLCWLAQGNKFRVCPVQWVWAILLMLVRSAHPHVRPSILFLLCKRISSLTTPQRLLLSNIIQTSVTLLKHPCLSFVTLFLFPFFCVSCSSCNPKISPKLQSVLFLLEKCYIKLFSLIRKMLLVHKTELKTKTSPVWLFFSCGFILKCFA